MPRKATKVLSFEDRLRAVGIGKLVLVTVIVIVGISVIFGVLQTALDTVAQRRDASYESVAQSGSAANKGMYMNGSFAEDAALMAPSVRNVTGPTPLPIPGDGNYVPGNDAETYETRSYTASIRTSELDTVCDTVLGWKPREEVVFLEQSRGDTSCYFRFKVARSLSDDLLNEVRELDPEELSANTETIKQQVVDYTSQQEILERKAALIQETLEAATVAYDQLVELATETKDVESLTKVIDSKLSQLERLTRERIAVSAQLESLLRQKAEVLDRLDYDYFSIHVSKYEIFNWDRVVDQWVHRMQQFVHDLSVLLQNITLGLVLNLLYLAVVLLYGFIVLVLGKKVWHFVRRYWKE